MKKNDNKYNEDINLVEIIDNLVNSKKVIILTALIFTLISFVYTLQNESMFKSSLLIEIGQINNLDGPNYLIEERSSLIQDLKLNLVYKDDNVNIEKIDIIPIDEKLINVKYTSNSLERNKAFLNNLIGYIENKHSQIINNKKTMVKNEIDAAYRELDFINLKYQQKILAIEELVDNEKNSKSQIETNSPTLSILKTEMKFQLSSLSYKINERIIQLKDELENVNLRSQKTSVVSNIQTQELSQNKLIIFIGLVLGFISGIFIVIINEFVKTYRQRA